ncbi:hypothetical protein EHZ19_02165 [Paraburkholderia bannensis]|jgi:hypothetical protein|uniref:DUF6471 domain-containing protein n=1 Tax=Paraburkholderia tropica TaxID=92647 RepID=A0AAQ1GDF2_9BURK|nr:MULTISPECIES: DUF6471 domain-containing protein [Paraburkholderia]RQM50962.1 hypothetical protein EHZ19_02165 [Paraburkholderia bannensis]RQN40308.1 hypothetical protein EHZ25_02700 [Paraburkholderia tropica]SEJ33420.1 hypothetical protein SAMN05216550_10448 [Paraburkholderia tropica]
MADWYQIAGNVLRAELARQGVTYRQLAAAMAQIGVSETERSIASKLSRGSFSFAFYLQAMLALGRTDFRVDLTDVR